MRLSMLRQPPDLHLLLLRLLLLLLVVLRVAAVTGADGRGRRSTVAVVVRRSV